MKNFFKACIASLLCIFLGWPNNSNAQIEIQQVDAETLINDILAGPGVQIFNVTTTGNAIQWGSFNNGTSVDLSLNRGIMMTTGSIPEQIPDMNGPATNFMSTGVLGGVQNDADLNAILQSFGVNQGTRDVAVIEFDFIPAGQFIKFNYIFGSEEYNEFVCDQFFDVFGFFLSGPGINGPFLGNSVNLAIVPETNPPLPVGINTINNGVNGSGDQFCPPNGLANAQYFVDNVNSNVFAIDGYTRTLVAEANVECNQIYHIRLVLADGFDNIYDSFVFLEAESFESNVPTLTSSNLLPDSSIVEGCSPAILTFTRTDIDSALAIPINLGGTAINGEDYTGVPDTLFFQPGESTITVELQAIQDNLDEPVETVIISFTFINECGNDIEIVEIIKIRDEYQLEVSSSDSTINCPDPEFPLEVLVTGGYPPYNYEWQHTTENSGSLTFNITATDTFYVRITDILDCSFVEIFDTIIVTVNYDAMTSVTQDTVVCPGATLTFGTIFENGVEPYTIEWVDFGLVDSITVTPDVTSYYEYTITDGCGETITDSANVFLPAGPPILTISGLLFNTSVVEGCVNANLTFTRSNPVGLVEVPITYSGTATFGEDYTGLPELLIFEPGQSSVQFVLEAELDGLTEAVETIIISYDYTDECGQEYFTEETIQIIDEYELTFNSPDLVIDCPSDQVTVFVEVSGGFPPYTYEWSFNNLITPSINVPITESTSFIVTFSDSLNCPFSTITDTVTVELTYVPLTSITTDTTVCPGTTLSLTASIENGLAPYSTNWEGFGVNDTLVVTPVDSTNFLYTLSDACGFTITDSVIVLIPISDTLEVTTTDTTICKGQLAILFGNAINGYGDNVYVWTGPPEIVVFNDSISNVTPATTSTYILTVTDKCNNSVSSELTVTVDPCELVVGTAFSPNSDGVNDFFEIDFIEFYPNNTLYIFNRWGKKLLEEKAYKNTWNGDNVPSGTYFYILDPGDGTTIQRGTFMIFKD
jgi:gliding motility-associated-like protein